MCGGVGGATGGGGAQDRASVNLSSPAPTPAPAAQDKNSQELQDFISTYLNGQTNSS